jgi:hypothetical protein
VLPLLTCSTGRRICRYGSGNVTPRRHSGPGSNSTRNIQKSSASPGNSASRRDFREARTNQPTT